ncbi:malate transporter [Synechococcus sp. RSCCF101]|uniref:AEC family transporter n=1 Tax=Synechococcus sp. RSCCF101 TaxID=2511069 RepID=UPI001243B535|nr:AEC family transporter [Synechococcus sp. RSCCF101]QEY32074.1 malate transporter [Synechococcus sp. RSCCF101]
MLQLLLDLVPAIGLGLLLGRRHPELAARLAPPLVRFGVPLSITALLLRAGLRWQLLDAALVALLAIGLALLLLSGLQRRRPALQAGACRLGGVVGNTAYFGIPAALALLPPEAVAYSVSYDVGATLFAWTFGPALISGQALGGPALLRTLWRSPASRGLLLALLLQVSPWSEPIAAALWWPARIVILLALLVVGARIGALTRTGLPSTGRLPLPLLSKLVLFPALLLGLCLLLDLPLLVRQAVVLQGAAPTAIAVLLMAEAAGTDVDAASAMVLWSTLLALITVPLWGWLLT